MVKRVCIYVAILGLIATSCSKYGFVNLNYPLDPAVSFPENVQNIAVVNRSLTKTDDKQKKTVESIFTGEIAGSDKRASDECIRAVYDHLNGRMGINIIIPSKSHLYGSGTRDIPELLDWQIVQNVCDAEKVDALLVLETFDSNSDVVVKAVTEKVVTVINGGKPNAAMPGQVRMNVLCYWRLYDPRNKTIIDQYRSISYLTFNGNGSGLTIAPPEALPNTAYAAGEEYVSRFLSGYYSVRRDMYKKGKGSAKHQFQAAFRAAEMAEWENAIEKWKEVERRGNRKSAGRACLDIAVAYEVLGKTDLALQWVKKAYQDYDDKLARDYVKILMNRKNLE